MDRDVDTRCCCKAKVELCGRSGRRQGNERKEGITIWMRRAKKRAVCVERRVLAEGGKLRARPQAKAWVAQGEGETGLCTRRCLSGVVL